MTPLFFVFFQSASNLARSILNFLFFFCLLLTILAISPNRIQTHTLALFFSAGSAVSARHPRSPFPRATHTSSKALDRILASTLLIHFSAFFSCSPRQLFSTVVHDPDGQKFARIQPARQLQPRPSLASPEASQRLGDIFATYNTITITPGHFTRRGHRPI